MTFSAVLLVGGESRRMGRDKATMEFEGEPLWRRQLQLLRALKPQELFVSARTKPEWLPDDAELLLDDPPSRGPLSGLTKALIAMQTTHLIALAVDMPFMTVGELRRLREQATKNRGVIPVIGERAEPLAAIYPTDAVADFKAALVGDDFSLQRLARKFGLDHEIAGEESVGLYRSLNTPEFDA